MLQAEFPNQRIIVQAYLPPLVPCTNFLVAVTKCQVKCVKKEGFIWVHRWMLSTTAGKTWRQEQEEAGLLYSWLEGRQRWTHRLIFSLFLQLRAPAHGTFAPTIRVLFSLQLNLSRSILRDILKGVILWLFSIQSNWQSSWNITNKSYGFISVKRPRRHRCDFHPGLQTSHTLSCSSFFIHKANWELK